MNFLVALAALLLVVWIVLKLTLAITGALLHLLWIAAVVMFAIWLIGKLRGSGAP